MIPTPIDADTGRNKYDRVTFMHYFRPSFWYESHYGCVESQGRYGKGW